MDPNAVVSKKEGDSAFCTVAIPLAANSRIASDDNQQSVQCVCSAFLTYQRTLLAHSPLMLKRESERCGWD
jgi:hypothetical protein